ncbi:isopeptide-forming domain-containing fimbrial protein [Atopobiaceae bacterium 24-176]
MRHRALWGAAVAATAATALLLVPKPAFAYEVTYVDSYNDVPVTEAYLDRFDGRMPDEVTCSPSVKSRKISDGTVRYYVDDTSYAPESAPKTVKDAMRIVYRKAGTTLDGRSLDVALSMDVTWSNKSPEASGGLPTFLRTPGVSGSALDWEAGSLVPVEGQPWDSVKMSIGISIKNRLEVSLSDTGKPFEGRVLLWLRDLDQWTGGPFSRETIELLSGFSDDVYVGKNTRLARDDLARGLFRPVDGTGDDGTRTDFVAFIEGGRAQLRWQGEECSTAFRSIYPETYPPIADDPVYNPVKSVTAVSGKPVADPASATALPGQAVTFEVEQALPYVVESNKPQVVRFVDDLNSRFDPSTAKVKVFQGDKDVSDNWRVSVNGNRVMATALDTKKAVLGLTFQVTATLKNDASGTAVNQATTTVVTRTQQNVEKRSNAVRVKVASAPKELVVSKRVKASDLLAAHGMPSFPFKVTVHGAKGDLAVLYGLASFEGEREDGGNGWAVAQATFDLTPFNPTSIGAVVVEEVPVSRYRLLEATGKGSWARSGRCLTLSYETVPDTSRLECTFINEKVVDRWFGHTASAVNDLSLEP